MRKIALSLEGAEFLPFAREILAQENAARAALGRGSLTATGTLRFTAPSTFAPVFSNSLSSFSRLSSSRRFCSSKPAALAIGASAWLI